ncbi:MAG: adenylate/guanylate cyclase domain-containing protein [Acidimicrobiales bacterium]
MAVCPSCEASNPEGNAFCGQCGSTLDVVACLSCGAHNGAAQRYCGSCGTALDGETPAGPSSAAVEERKLATVLFADVVGFTSLAERTDHEIVARMVDTAFRQLGELVAEHGGIVDKFMGDSVMAVFGVPVAHDDDAERAVAAALGMRDLGGDLCFSIGVNSGEVMATAVGRAGDYTVIGDTVNVAARLEKMAGPGEVLCGRLTAELARSRIRFREHAAVVVKGKREPVEAWVADSLRPLSVQGASDGPSLIGRDDELAFLLSTWRRAVRDNDTHVLVLAGEAGVGKTRLVDELAQRAAADGRVVRATYPAYGVMGGARLAGEVLAQLGSSSDSGVDSRTRSVTGVVDPALESLDPAGLQREQLWGYLKFLQEKGGEGPLLLAIDDMHRADDRTVELVGELANRLSGVPVLLLLAGRTEPGDWRIRMSAAAAIRLAPLSRADAASLASAFAGQRRLAPEAAEFLAERSSGNPLYLRELVATAEARGMFTEDGDELRLSIDEAIPATLHALLASRMDALAPPQKLALQHLAVLGDAATVEQVAGLGSTRAEATLHSLVEGGLLNQTGQGSYEVPDPLLAEVAYETLPRNVRGELHRTAATLVGHSHERARHLDRAAEYLHDDEDLVTQAADALAVAGQELIGLARHLDAYRLLERSVALGCRRAPMLLALARLQGLYGNEEDAAVTLDLIADDSADPSVAVERDHTAANLRLFSDPEWALPRLREAAERWHLLGETSKQAWAMANTGVSLFNLSRFREAAETLETAVALFEAAGDLGGRLAATSFFCLVKPDDKRVSGWLEEALAFADAVGDRGKQLNVLTTLTWNRFFSSMCGTAQEVAEAEGFAERLTVLAEEMHSTELCIHGLGLMAVMARQSGRLQEASRLCDALQRVTAASGRSQPWLAWAVSYSVAVATGASGATPPFPPRGSADPVDAMARSIIELELLMAGRVEEAVGHTEGTKRGGIEAFSDLTGVFGALGLVLAGRPAEALPRIDKCMEVAATLEAGPVGRMAVALLAEVTGEPGGLPPPPVPARSLADLLVLRAWATLGGSAEVLMALTESAKALGMPGLLIGVKPSRANLGRSSGRRATAAER